MMVDGTRNVLAAAREAGVERFVLMSALGTSRDDEGRSCRTARAKWQMEQDVAASGLEHVIFRPSFVFGKDGGVLPTFVRQVRYSPVVTVLGPGTARLQPIWVDDVAAHFARALDLPDAANRTFELGGPDASTWNELYARIARVLGKRRALRPRPVRGRAHGRAADAVDPAAHRSRADQVTMLEAGDNVVTGDDAAETFGLPLVGLDEQIRRVA